MWRNMKRYKKWKWFCKAKFIVIHFFLPCQCLSVKMASLCIPDSLRGSHPENWSGPPDPLAAVLWQWHLSLHVHWEEFQAHPGEAAASGPLQPHSQQRPGRYGEPGPPPNSVQCLDPQRWAVQGPAHHPQPAGDGADQPVLQGLLAARGRRPWGQQNQKPEGAEGAEEASQPPASRGPDESSRDMKSLDLQPVTFEQHHLSTFHFLLSTLHSRAMSPFKRPCDRKDLTCWMNKHNIYCRLYKVILYTYLENMFFVNRSVQILLYYYYCYNY